jgi:hypothetical protein
MRRRRRELEAWDRPMADAESSAQWLLVRVLPAPLDVRDPVHGAAAWSVARPRFLELDEQLTGLIRTAPDPERRATAASLRVALADLANALDERARVGSPEGGASAGLRVELARDRLERRLAHEPPPLVSSAPGAPPT